ncbi:MAG: ABC transporter permease [Lachnospiraceae bacterium]|nr:ABC transporter permease [Lachnospiraceae bacterium]
MVGFTVIPLLLIGWYGFGTRDGHFTWNNILAIAKPEHLKPLIASLILSVACTVICLLVAYPLAMILKKANLKRSSFVIFIFVLPMWMNFLLRTYAWLNLLDDGGLVLNFMRLLGFKGNIVGTYGAIILGMVYNYLPFMVLPLYNAISKIDDNVLDAARDLGANEAQVTWRVMVPLSFPGIVSGITMVFVPSLTTFVVSDLLGGRKIFLIGNIIEQEFSTASNWNLGSGLSLVLMVFILISMAILNHYDKTGEGTTL